MESSRTEKNVMCSYNIPKVRKGENMDRYYT